MQFKSHQYFTLPTSTALAAMFVLLTNACSTGHFKLSTSPDGAQVSALYPNGEEHPLGRTPFETVPGKLLEDCRPDSSASELCHLIVVKKGYVRESLFLGPSALRSRTEARLKLVPVAAWMDGEKSQVSHDAFNSISHSSAKVQQLVFKGDLDAALNAAKDISTRYPDVAAGWALLGNVFYLKKMVPQAIEAYQKSLAINPSDADAQNVIKILNSQVEAKQ